jgi:hypothetical protein
MIWGEGGTGLDDRIRDTKPPDAGGGLKAGDKYTGEMIQAVATGTAAVGAANICGAGQAYYPELAALFAGEL